MNLTGIYTFKSLVYHDEPTEDKVIAGAEEGDMMEAIADEIRKAGVPIAEISAGSTPTGVEVAKTGKVDEIRPGTYIFKDHMLCKEGAARTGRHCRADLCHGCQHSMQGVCGD